MEGLPRTETTNMDASTQTAQKGRSSRTETTKVDGLLRPAADKMEDGWHETFWKIIQTEMGKFVYSLDNADDEYAEFNDYLMERRVRELERLGLTSDHTPEAHNNAIDCKYLRKADVLADIRAVEFLRVYEKDRAKRHKVSKGFRKAYNICPQDLAKDIGKAPREVIDTLNKRADLIFTKMNKIHEESFKQINKHTEFILTSWLEGQRYHDDEIKFAEGRVALYWNALDLTNFGTNFSLQSKDVSNEEDDTSVEGEEEEIDFRGRGVSVSSHNQSFSSDNHP
ncbi:hypothetical protein EIK77_007859 [Talaromyces pinophilus]|nr:hypothetical protein EIK77_007859 [Talaromyces pinophilus]PCH01903.1 Hypothetical protein PENO1_040410 [Penicillium occitanis (nom. inval.)]PCH04184.1 hypothetical protein PENOC_034990 [Penicillium occitanis (nom. inval.)]